MTLPSGDPARTAVRFDDVREELLDAATQPADLVAAYAFPLPVRVIVPWRTGLLITSPERLPAIR